MGRGTDQKRMGQAFASPGQDTRTWVAYGLVDKDTKDAKAIQFKDDSGTTSPYGPLVSVTLQPSGISLPCRVGYHVAGGGEGEWFPFVEGDEVLVVVPEGNERAGAVIVARLNNEIDEWPAVVGGQDASKNTFGFRRMRTPFVVETGASYLIRSAKTGSQIGIDPNGNVIINDGDKGSLLIGPEALSLSSGDGTTFVTVLPPSSEVYLGADTATFLLNPTETKFISTGDISFATAGGSPLGHGISAEQVVAFVMNVLAQLATTSSFTAGPLASAAYGAAPPASCQTAIASVVGPALAALGGVAPLGPAPGGEFLEFQASTPPIFGPAGAFTAAMSNALATADPTGAVLGFGRAGFKL